MRTVVFVGLLLVSALCFVPQRKQLAGPPSEFARHRLPTPLKQSISENSALFRTTLSAAVGLGEPVFTGDVPVDSEDGFSLAVFSPVHDKLSFELTAPNGTVVELERFRSEVDYPVSDSAVDTVPGTMFVFENHQTGIWHFRVFWAERVNSDAALRILLYNADPLAVHAQLTTYDLIEGRQFGLIADIRDSNNQPIETVDFAELEVIFPDGTEHDTKMHDDGLNGDRVANDHEYTATVTATEVGDYVAQAVFRGKNAKGVEFIRTSEHLVRVTSQQLELVGTSVMTPLSGNTRIHVEIDVKVHGAVADKHYHAHAEVLGTSKSSGELVDICWMGAMVDVDNQGDRTFVTLELDLAWLEAANATEPLQLSNVYIQDASNQIPLTRLDSIVLYNRGEMLDDLLSSLAVAVDASGEVIITETMRKGVRPSKFAYSPRRNDSLGSSENPVVLVHGYCSDANVFAESPSDWTNPHFFLNAHASLGNDAFALKVAEYAAPLGAYTVVGHSQGGIVSTHLHNYYWTGMDSLKSDTGPNDNEHRLIQTLGSPFLGNTGAGVAADFIKIFGVGCGSNSDLSTDGSALWLSGITTDTVSEVYYYTASYTGKFLDYCSLPVQLVLKKPNDGVAELSLSQLPGANNQGNKEGWCHSVKMKYEDQKRDHVQNKVMNSLKA